MVFSLLPVVSVLSLAVHVLGAGHDHHSNLKRHLNVNANTANSTTPQLVVRHEGVLAKRFDDARFSFFDTGLGACGGFNVASDWIVALNAPQFDSDPTHHCNVGITIEYGGKTAQAIIADRCEECPYGALDFTRGLFDYFGSEDQGYLYGTWNFNDGSSDPPPPSPSPPPPPPTSSDPPPPPSTSQAASSTATPSTSATQSASPSTSGVPTGAIAQFNLAFLELGGLIDAGASAA